MAIIIIAIGNILYPSIIGIALLRYTLIGLFMYVSFLFVEYPGKKSRSFLASVLDITFFGRVIAILRRKDYVKPKVQEEMRSLFLYGLVFSIVIVVILSLYSFFALNVQTSTPPILVNSITLSNTTIIDPALVTNNPTFIIKHNLIFVAEILIGSLFLYGPAFGALLFNSAVLGPAIVVALEHGVENLLFPHLVLELLGTSIAAGTGLLIFYSVCNLFAVKGTDDPRYKRFERFMQYSIVLLAILAAFAFILAWSVEYAILQSMSTGPSLPTKWFASVYLSDAILVLLYGLVVYSIFWEKFFSPVKVGFYLALPSALFFILSGGKSSFLTYEWLIFAYAAASMFIAIREILLKSFGKILSRKVASKLKELEECGFGFLFTLGKSMKPTIESGDLLLTYSKIDGLPLQVGDIVSYRPSMKYSSLIGSQYVAHRIVALTDRVIITRGDNLRRSDPPTSLENVDYLVVGKLSRDASSNAFKYTQLTNHSDIAKEGERLVSKICDVDFLKSLVISRRANMVILSSSLFVAFLVTYLVLIL